jgi:hypothetical protein
MSRQKQLEDEVDSALQTLIELNDEGRLLFGGSVDDVGRIVLRRGMSRDVGSVRKLLSSNNMYTSSKLESSQMDSLAHSPSMSSTDPPLPSTISPVSLLGLESNMANRSASLTEENDDLFRLPALLWGSHSFILVLSRAVALHDEPPPPLGCVVLTLDFSFSKGRTLHICEIGHEEHLPLERFMECLQAFAKHMKCSLERESGGMAKEELNPTTGSLSMSRKSKNEQSGAKHRVRPIQISQSDLVQIVKSHVEVISTASATSDHAAGITTSVCSLELYGENDKPATESRGRHRTLSSVKEEEFEEEERNSEEVEPAAKATSARGDSSLQTQNKPSKRSRVA